MALLLLRRLGRAGSRAWRVGVLASLVILGYGAAARPLAEELTAAERDDLAREARLIVDLLQNHHYLGRSLSAIRAAELIDTFVRDLDPEALLFTRADVDHVHQRFDRTLKGVYLYRGELQPALEIFELFRERCRVRGEWIQARLGRSFDLAAEVPWPDEAKPAFTSDTRELDARWERWLREHVIGGMLLGMDEAHASGRAARHFDDWTREIARTDALTVRERFMNLLLADFDPHSGYASADSARAFDEMMGAASFSIGLVLERSEGHWQVADLVPGGPAELSGAIERGDILVDFAEADEAWQDLGALRFREIARRLWGEEGSRCRVAWRHPGDDERHEVELPRRRLVWGSQRASGAVWTIASGPAAARVGWIGLPAFYGGGEQKVDSASATRDVRELVTRLQAADVDGLVLDLRQNGGGAILEAAAIAGLFLDGGIATQRLGLDGVVTPQPIGGDGAIYRGPLVVLVSSRSASASELLAGALQYHRRAVVVGAAQTYGKGTLQDYIDLPAAVAEGGPKSSNWGVLRLTSQVFFQPDGSAIQRRGIAADIVLPERLPGDERREADLPGALPESDAAMPRDASVERTASGVVSDHLMSHLREASDRRVAASPEFRYLANERAYRETHRPDADRGRSLAHRRERQLAADRARAALLEDYFRYAREGFATSVEFVNVPDVAEAYAAHQRHLRETPFADGGARVGRWNRGSYFAMAPDGRVVDVRIDGFIFSDALADAAILAEAASRETGLTFTAGDLARLLRALDALPARDDAAVLRCIREILTNVPDDSAARCAMQALLHELVERDAAILRPETVPDVVLREGLRVALDWARSPPVAAPSAADGGRDEPVSHPTSSSP